MPTFLYDGDCAFCSACARFVERRILPRDPATRAHVLPWQFADLDALGLTADECTEAVQWVHGDRHLAGPDAIAALLHDSGRGWRPLGWLLGRRAVRPLAWRAYRWVARHRHQMPGGTAACAVPRTDSPQRPESLQR
jgi:predicted DCC family thiol-disulfide oxidoreductase YuxK